MADALSAYGYVLDGVEVPLSDGGVVGGGRQASVAASVLWPGVTRGAHQVGVERADALQAQPHVAGAREFAQQLTRLIRTRTAVHQ